MALQWIIYHLSVGNLRIVVMLLSLASHLTPFFGTKDCQNSQWSRMQSYEYICSMSTQVSPISFRFLVLRVVGSSMIGFFFMLEWRNTCWPGNTFMFDSLMAGYFSFNSFTGFLAKSQNAQPQSFWPQAFFYFFSLERETFEASVFALGACWLYSRSSFFLLSNYCISQLLSSFQLILMLLVKLISSFLEHFLIRYNSSLYLSFFLNSSLKSKLCDFSLVNRCDLKLIFFLHILSALRSLGCTASSIWVGQVSHLRKACGSDAIRLISKQCLRPASSIAIIFLLFLSDSSLMSICRSAITTISWMMALIMPSLE